MSTSRSFEDCVLSPSTSLVLIHFKLVEKFLNSLKYEKRTAQLRCLSRLMYSRKGFSGPIHTAPDPFWIRDKILTIRRFVLIVPAIGTGFWSPIISVQVYFPSPAGTTLDS